MKGKKVYVGMSGGVDSSVSAALLKEAGFDVTGVFIKVWQPDWMECTWREDRLDAMRVAVRLGIPFQTLDLEREYKKEVVDYMIAEYKAGKTPNPDVMCNTHVKFGGFFRWAMAQGADFVATGHYARAEKGRLFMGKDQSKDQSYFLYALSGKDLEKCLFPVGGMDKSETRKLAKSFGLPVADKKDSQGLCFIGKVDFKEFLSHYVDAKPGPVMDESGKTIGSHDGAIFLTVGERHGFSVESQSPDGKPYYIVARDIAENSVTVAHKGSEAISETEKREYELSSVHWVFGKPAGGKKLQARIRHLGQLLSCELNGGARISFDEPLSIASGQSIVVYDGEECLGGGIVA